MPEREHVCCVERRLSEQIFKQKRRRCAKGARNVAGMGSGLSCVWKNSSDKSDKTLCTFF